MKHKVLSQILTVVVLALAGFAFMNWQANQGNESANILEEEQEVKPLYWAVGQSGYMPFTERSEKGELIGMDVELLRAIADEVGIEISFRPQEMKMLFKTLDMGNADIVLGGMNITAERQQKYLFTQPYLTDHWALVLNKTHNQLNNWGQLKNKTVAAVEDSAAQTRLSKWGNIQQRLIGSLYLGVSSVQNKKADAFLGAARTLRNYVKQDSNLYLLPEKQERISFAFIVKKDNNMLKQQLDKGLAAIRANGKYDAILAKYGQKAS